jgi:hypothetical protein
MKKIIANLRDTIVAGILFLLPVLILFVVLSKAWASITGVTGKIAHYFGVSSIMGVSGGTLVATVSLLVLCLVCGYLMRIALFKNTSAWIDKKLQQFIPGYALYRAMAMKKIEPQEETLPYTGVVLLNDGAAQKPAFLVQQMADGRAILFVPSGGNPKDGEVLVAASTAFEILPASKIKAVKMAFANEGIGMADALFAGDIAPAEKTG